MPTCSEAGVLGAVTGVMGTLQATEVLKEILGIGDTPGRPAADLGCAGDALPHRAAAADPHCALCGPDATIHDLSPHRDAGGARLCRLRPLGVLLISGGHDRAHYAFVLATGAAALGRAWCCSPPTPAAECCSRIGPG